GPADPARPDGRDAERSTPLVPPVATGVAAARTADTRPMAGGGDESRRERYPRRDPRPLPLRRRRGTRRSGPGTLPRAQNDRAGPVARSRARRRHEDPVATRDRRLAEAPGRGAAMKAYVLITAEVGKSPSIQDTLRQAGVSQVDAVAGTYDLVAVIEAEDPKRLGELVMGMIQRTDGVLSTVTLLSIG